MQAAVFARACAYIIHHFGYYRGKGSSNAILIVSYRKIITMTARFIYHSVFK